MIRRRSWNRWFGSGEFFRIRWALAIPSVSLRGTIAAGVVERPRPCVCIRVVVASSPLALFLFALFPLGGVVPRFRGRGSLGGDVVEGPRLGFRGCRRQGGPGNEGGALGPFLPEGRQPGRELRPVGPGGLPPGGPDAQEAVDEFVSLELRIVVTTTRRRKRSSEIHK